MPGTNHPNYYHSWQTLGCELPDFETFAVFQKVAFDVVRNSLHLSNCFSIACVLPQKLSKWKGVIPKMFGIQKGRLRNLTFLSQICHYCYNFSTRQKGYLEVPTDLKFPKNIRTDQYSVGTWATVTKRVTEFSTPYKMYIGLQYIYLQRMHS